MDGPIQPIFLYADSQLLFLKDGEVPYLDRVRRQLEGESPRAAYVGASNGDRPEFYQLFVSAMETIGVTDCRMIPSAPSPEDLEYFDSADLILLAGGDVERGFKTFEKNGLRQKVIERYYTGALLMGISAGAVQLGLYGFRETEGNGSEEPELFDTFKLVPLVVDVHQEPDWARLARAMPEVGDLVQGLGIPSGAGAVVHPDMTVEPVRRPLAELSVKDGEVRQSLILPPGEAGDAEEGVGRAAGAAEP